MVYDTPETGVNIVLTLSCLSKLQTSKTLMPDKITALLVQKCILELCIHENQLLNHGKQKPAAALSSVDSNIKHAGLLATPQSVMSKQVSHFTANGKHLLCVFW